MKHHQFDWEAYLGFTVESDDGIYYYIKEDSETRKATLEHRVLWNQMITFKAQRDDLLEALEDCLRVVEFLASDSCPTTIQNAKAAIAKSTGEQQ
jgi:hypothetical protein